MGHKISAINTHIIILKRFLTRGTKLPLLLVNMSKTAGVGLHIIREADLLSQFGKNLI
jgi:hypothetical protein